ncbi:NAD-dependent epimerase/dehydratase family protein [Allopontixanthobacter sp.]|uniref:NAD-dependent epimerase/dehydratase family protein n=1 Tax=Allopontixanthobacter sp. TaxID=2906452 RepID=UPI002ABCFFA5|nr:NAD-dependent epimerase/dehydratase family protein [Allopontixanthobacter sp.]MDZ4306792.1 NAD-dependent epimerase/dehydratase family protein [Allopontixanthobacter sp.]
MKIAVTGGTGFVGQAVLDLMQQRGAAARVLARTVPEDRQDIEWVAGNLGDTAALDRLLAGADAVLHIAGLTNTPDPANFTAANVAGTAAVLAAAKRAGVERCVFVSSLSAREASLSAYGASKAQAEDLVARSGLDWTIVRPPAVYGPRDKDMFELFKSARLGFIPLPPGGATSLIHVDDLARLLIALLPSSPRVRHQLFEPDDGREGGWSHKEMAAAIGDAVGRRVVAPHLPRSVLLGAARLDRLLRGNAAKLTADRVGYMCHPNWVVRSDRSVPADVWTPSIATQDGLKSTAEWYRQQGWL